jgi:hypothetical protein
VVAIAVIRRAYIHTIYKRISYATQGTIVSELYCNNSVPIEFKRFFELIRSDKDLDRRHLQRLFRDLFCCKHFQYGQRL